MILYTVAFLLVDISGFVLELCELCQELCALAFELFSEHVKIKG